MTNADEEIQHIERDTRGVAWIKGTGMKLIELVREHLAYGWSADELHEQHPALTLGQIHSALGFFYDHQSEFETEMERADQEFARLRALTGESAAQRRLRALARKG